MTKLRLKKTMKKAIRATRAMITASGKTLEDLGPINLLQKPKILHSTIVQILGTRLSWGGLVLSIKRAQNAP